MPKIISVNVTAIVHEENWAGDVGKTGIDKRPILGRVGLENNQVEGDVISDKKHHGGFDMAVYAYAHEDLQWWEKEIGTKINPGRFGENLTTSGIDINKSLVGERWKIGTALLEVSIPRIPCRVFAGFWDRPNLIKEFTNARRSGTYLRIIEEGYLESGDEINVVFKPNHTITIKDVFDAKSGDRSKINEIAKVEELSTSYKQWANKIASGQGDE